EQGISFFLAWGNMLQGWVLVAEGQTERGLALIRYGLASRAAGARLWQSYWLAVAAEVCGEAGRIDEALDLLAEALAYVNQSGERFHEPELYRLKGELTHKQCCDKNPESSFKEATTCFQRAIAIARQQ